MNSEILIILGSTRKNSNTKTYLEQVFKGISRTEIDLLDYKFTRTNTKTDTLPMMLFRKLRPGF